MNPIDLQPFPLVIDLAEKIDRALNINLNEKTIYPEPSFYGFINRCLRCSRLFYTESDLNPICAACKFQNKASLVVTSPRRLDICGLLFHTYFDICNLPKTHTENHRVSRIEYFYPELFDDENNKPRRY